MPAMSFLRGDYTQTSEQLSVDNYYNEIEQPVSEIFFHMSNRGICVDLEYLSKLKIDLEQQKEPIEKEIKNELGEINLNSPKKLLEALNEKEIYPEFKNKPSTDKRALEQLASNPIVNNLLRFSQLDTLLHSFVISYLERGQSIVHPFFNQVGTRTGRPSCRNPNLLQIPKHTENGQKVRKMFIARPGMLLGDCDFGQIEPRVLAHLSKDPNMCALFNDGLDFHQFTADKLSISRDRAKVLNLSVGYRASYKSVSQQLKCEESVAQKEIDKWWDLFPTLRRWQDRVIWQAKNSGYTTTLLGLRIKIEDLDNPIRWKREKAERQTINNITQGSAAEIMKLAMIHINRDFGFSSLFGLLIQVYDELVFESKEIESDITLVKDNMEHCIALEVPLVVNSGVGNNWSDCK